MRYNRTNNFFLHNHNSFEINSMSMRLQSIGSTLTMTIQTTTKRYIYLNYWELCQLHTIV